MHCRLMVKMLRQWWHKELCESITVSLFQFLAFQKFLFNVGSFFSFHGSLLNLFWAVLPFCFCNSMLHVILHVTPVQLKFNEGQNFASVTHVILFLSQLFVIRDITPIQSVVSGNSWLEAVKVDSGYVKFVRDYCKLLFLEQILPLHDELHYLFVQVFLSQLIVVSGLPTRTSLPLLLRILRMH